MEGGGGDDVRLSDNGGGCQASARRAEKPEAARAEGEAKGRGVAMLTHFAVDVDRSIQQVSLTLPGVSNRMRWLLPLVSASFLMVTVLPAAAQTGPDRRAQEQGQKPPSTPADAAKESQKRTDEFAEAAQKIGGPAGQAECVWLGRRVVNLLWRDDLETAFRHLDLYDRFGCPGGHIQASFRCVVRQGQIDPKAPESLNARVHACWIDPETPPTPAPAAAAKPGTNPQQ